ncbi:SufD family Fe-S cluster assembly protein [Sphingomonas ginsenosidivorax]|uniref:SufD family Fe-S cluster assembly protein n=1 Tax=Sphingomonas ginsenosidivorax TaxID=862135 RepID=A0A5C6U8T2_9SPHN|nr:SufD family Fe-S cluster assembly protein [Sphingomonas ginsenosidivorax]TXC68025.1 SufD family Fe-S cluster assembly protein [Sphingomonas ginsenosidivorax]
MTLALPSSRDEDWRWSDLSALPELMRAPVLSPNADLTPFWVGHGPRLVFVNGKYWPGRSRPGPIRLGSSFAANSNHPLGKLCVEGGWTLPIESAGEQTDLIEIIHLTTGGASHAPARISLKEGTRAAVLETYIGDGWANRWTHIRLASGSQLHRTVRLMQSSGFTSLRDAIDIGSDASLQSTVLGLGGAATRVDATIDLLAADAHVEYGGALLARGDQRQEAVVAVNHLARGASSRQTWRAVASDRAVVSLASRVHISRYATQTNAVQNLRGMLVDRAATINLKPEMVIYADDVLAAHGATVGALDEDALFYLMSRGISPRSAQAMLMTSFVADALGSVSSDVARVALDDAVAKWLEADI